jgi:C1A family cysteine protease
MVFTGTVINAEENQSLVFQKAPANPVFLKYQYNGMRMQMKTSGDNNRLGLIPVPFDLSYLDATYKSVGEAELMTFAASFDLRDTDPIKVTPVRDQGQAGSCWAFATYGSLESNTLPDETKDFSENNLKNKHGFVLAHNAGGNQFMSGAYLARWGGPISEADDPYNDLSGVSPSGLTVQKHVQEIYYLPARNKDKVKQALMTYGAVYTSMSWYNTVPYKCYNEATHAYYDNFPDDWYNYGNNHAVTIVGWDDNYPKANFYVGGYTTTPPGNGAWIIKNSWGTAWGESGYFYISYYDNNAARDNSVFLMPEETTNYQRIYQYDPLGCVDMIGAGSTTGWMANIFTAAASEPLSAVSFYAMAANTTYTIKIYTNASSGPISGTLAYTKSGTCPYAGYHTIAFPVLPALMLTAGQKFSVVVKVTTPGWNNPIAIEDYHPGYANPTASGNSYISMDGTIWSRADYYFDDADVCVKAFVYSAPTITAQPVSIIVDAETNPSFSVTAVGSAPLTYQWYFGENPIEDATAATLTLNNVTSDNNGNYTVAVTNANGSATSNPATLTVRSLLPPPMLDLADGTYSTPQKVSVFYPEGYTGVTIRYTTNGVDPTASSLVFSQVSPLAISKTTILKARAFKTGYTASHSATGNYTITGIVATPTFNVPGGAYTTSKIVTINCTTIGATIRYTLNGTEPTTDSLAYAGAIIIDHDTTLKAKAFIPGWESSATATAIYTLNIVATPTFSIPGGTYTLNQSVTIRCSTPGASIRYTTNGDTPTATYGTLGTTVNINANSTLKAIAYKTDFTSSEMASAEYVINRVFQPVFSIPNGPYGSEQTVIITCEDENAVIRYTTTGTEPTATSTAIISGGVVQISKTMTLKAKAFKTGWNPSLTTSALYTITTVGVVATPTFSSPSGTLAIPGTVNLNCATPGATIRYTTDGAIPTGASTIYEGPIAFTAPMAIKAKAFKTGMASSIVATGTYNATLFRPEFDLASGTYVEQTVTISCTVAGATFRYTTNGTEPTTNSPIVVGGTVVVNKSMTLKAKAFKTGWLASPTQTAIYTITQVATPTFNPPAGTYTAAKSVKISCATIGATVRYTTNGDEPTGSSPICTSTTVISVASAKTLKAKAFKAEMTDSNIAVAEYMITGTVATPIFYCISKNLMTASGSYASGLRVSVYCATEGAEIHYTTNGTTPTLASPVVDDSVLIESSVTLKAIAFKTGWAPSAVKSETYTIAQVATPQVSILDGNATISCATLGAVVRYTTSGVDPCLSDPVYSPGALIPMGAETILKAKAWKTGLTPSYVAVVRLQYELTVTNGANGSTTPSGTVTVIHSANTEISATPVEGYHFEKWVKTAGTGAVRFGNSNLAETTVTMTGGDATIRANFAINQYTLTVTNGGHGSTIPSGSNSVNHGVGTSINATPETGYHFVNWTVTSGTVSIADVNSASTSVTLTNGKATIRANFIMNPPYQILSSTPSALDFAGQHIYSILTAQPISKPQANSAPVTTYSYTLSSTGATASYSPNTNKTDSVEQSNWDDIGQQNIEKDLLQKSGKLPYGTAQINMDDIARKNENELLSTGYRQVSKAAEGYDPAAPVGPVIGTTWNNVYIVATGYRINTTCRYVSDHAYFFVDNRDSMSAYLAGYGTAFDAIYDVNASKLGNPNDVDNNGKVIIVLSQELSDGLLGYFYSRDKYPMTTYTDSNEGDIFYITTTAEYQGDTVKGTLAHELQHMIYFDEHYNRGVTSTFTWLNEALSQAAEYYNGYVPNHNAWMNYYLNSHWAGLSLTHWTSGNYGYGAVFIRYLIDQYGDTAIKNMCATNKVGVQAVEAATGADFNNIFNNFTRALVMAGSGDCTDPLYAFTSLDIKALQPDGRGGLETTSVYTAGATVSGDLYPYRLFFVAWEGDFGTMTLTGGSITGTAFGLAENLTINNDGNGSTSPAGAVMLDNGVNMTITATPNAGYQFINWTKTAGTGTVVFGNANAANTTVTVTGGDATIRANFTMPLGTWISGSITAGGSQWYCFKATTGTQYSIYWDDSYSGSGTYTCDVKVSAYKKNLTTTYFSGIDSGYYTPKTITALEDYVYIKVQGYFSDESGSFAIRVTTP